MRKTAVILFAALFIACSVPINASAGPDDDIPTNAQNTGVHNTLVDLLVKADLVTTLQGAGPFTVFAPTDQAFSDAGIAPGDFNTQKEIDVLADILLYHVVFGEVYSGDLTDGMDAFTANDDPVIFSVTSTEVRVNDAKVTTADVTSSNGVIHVIDEVLLPPVDVYVSSGSFSSPYYDFFTDSTGTDPLNNIDITQNYKFQRLNDASSHAFYIGDNGYKNPSSAKLSLVGDGTHTAGITGASSFTVFFNDGFAVDDTLTYFCTQHQIMEGTFTLTAPLDDIPTIATNTGVHNTLVNALTQANLVATLQGTGPFTVFAPTDQAFTDAGIDLSTISQSALEDVLLYHVVSGTVPSSAVTDCMSADALNNKPLSFTVGTTVMVNDATVTGADVLASNGVIHVIDKVLTPTETPRDIPRTAQCTGQHDSLVAALTQASLVTTLQGPGPFTVFAPTDQAFTDAGIDLAAVSQADLQDLLTYHVVSGEVPSSAVTDCMSADALNSQPLSFKVDGSVMVNDATVTGPDVATSNGIIHVIDKVLTPSDAPNDIPRTAQCTGEHDSLVAAIVQAELLTTLQGAGPFTVFAPTDQAFTDAGINLADYTTTEGKATLSNILRYHVVSGSVPSSALTNGMTATAENGDDLTFDLTSGVKVNDATVTGADVATSNGIIHVIDKVLMPPQGPVDIAATAASTGDHNTLVSALTQASLVATLQGDGPFTVFAPTDQAFTEAGIDLSTISQADLENVLLYHVVAGSVPSSAVTDCMSADSQNTQPLSFTVDSGVMVNDANVIQADVIASNGIIHVIDKVLTPSDTPNDIPRTAQCTGSHNTLVTAVVQAGLLETLQGEGPFTVFAPTDQAFSDAGIDLSAVSNEDLSGILTYHVVSGAVPASAVTDCLSADTVNTKPLAFKVDDAGVMVNDANVTQADVYTSNGIIHVIDKVLTPSDTPNDIPRTAQCTGSHGTLVTAVVQAGLLETLQGEGPFTVFAPTDQAFTDAGIDLSAVSNEDLSGILTYHVVSGAVPASAVTDCLSADTVNGNPLSFTVDANGVMVNGATVTQADVNTSNGIIHVIDKVLMPTATPKDIPRTAQCTGNHNTLVTAVIQAGLLETLQGDGPFTVFAPTDQAFADAGIDLSAVNQSTLSDILLYHVVSANVPSNAITDGMEQIMVNQDKVTFSIGSGVMINGANITATDVATSNGVIHVIDKVLMPPEETVADSDDDTVSASDDDDEASNTFIWIAVVVLLVLGGGAGAVFFVRRKGADATLAKDFSSGGLMNQLQPVDTAAYQAQTPVQATAQAEYQPQPVQTVEVVQQPVVAEPTILRQWTDDAGYTWRAMDDGTAYWWTGSEWKKYG